MNGFQQLRQFNRFAGENVSLIKKALTSATGVGEGLIPQSLEKEITNLIIRLSPELAMMQSKKIAGKYHEFNRLTALPGAGGQMGENATTPTTNSTTSRTGVTLKVVRRKGAVTNFLQDSSSEYIDAASYEMENQLIAQIYDLVNIVLYGNASANTYEFDGLDKLIGTTDATATPVNRKIAARYGDTQTNLKFLDAMIDKSNRKGGSKHRRVFVMSPEMLSFVSQTLTNVRLNQGLVGTMSQVEINGGWRLNAYRDIPIVESSSTRPQTTMGTLTPGTAGSGGHIADSTTYYFKVAAVTLNGEELAAATSQATGAPGTAVNTITIGFTAVTGALKYKVYCSTTQNAEKLVQVVPSSLYDANGTIVGDKTVNSITFTSNPAVYNCTGTYTDGTTTTALSTTSVSLWQSNDIAYEQDSQHDVPESIFLWDLDPIQGLGKLVYTNQGGSNFDGLITTTPLAQTDDFLPFLVKSYCALVPSADFTSYYYRGVRTY